MKNKEISDFLKQYLKQNKTCSAIMLKAPWGTGKSYYIQNELIPHLNNDPKKEQKCIVVSLYGLKDLFDVSKAIYLECRMKFLRKRSEKTTAGVLAANTVIKGITNFFNIDLSQSKKEIQKLYNSIDLSGKLIVFEDLERSDIDIIEILGYVNNLVEQGKAKVLLVANEDELIQYEPIHEGNQENQETVEELDGASEHRGKKYTNSTQQYLKAKEKTVSDTILFECDLVNAIKHIMKEIGQEHLKPFLNTFEVSEIQALLENQKITNLRTFIFACQKAKDLFERMRLDPATDLDFIKTVFYGIIIFSHKVKAGTPVKWEEGPDFSIRLSCEKYPLFRFCYDYIMWHSLDDSKIDNAKKALEKLRLYDKTKSFGDSDLQVLYNWPVRSEKEVSQAVESIAKRLQNEGDIAFYEYGKIAVHLINIHYVIRCNIESAKHLLIKNLHNKGNKIEAEYLFPVLNNNENPEAVEEFKKLQADMLASLAAPDVTLFDFDYKPTSLAAFYDNVSHNYGKFLTERSFMSKLDPNKISDMLKSCNAENIWNVRGVFQSVYGKNNIHDFFADDKDKLAELLANIKELEKNETFDKIQRMQLRYFEDDLNQFIAKL